MRVLLGTPLLALVGLVGAPAVAESPALTDTDCAAVQVDDQAVEDERLPRGRSKVHAA